MTITPDFVEREVRAAWDMATKTERERIRKAFLIYAAQPWACPHRDEWQRAMADILDWLPTLPG